MTRLFIWRHGQTAWNVSDRIQGHTDVDLDNAGRAQAVAAAAQLAVARPDAIVSSDLHRAADTAAALSAVTGLPVHIDARLRERNFGAWQGMSGAEAEAAYPEAFARWRRGEPVRACGVEDTDAMQLRVTAAVMQAAAMVDGGGTVVVVTHGGAARHALGALLDWPTEATSRVLGLGNCHWSELHRHPTRGWLLRAHNIGALPAPAPRVERAAHRAATAADVPAG